MEQSDKSNHISFCWDLHYTCDYRCPYCWWHGRWEKLAEQNVYPSLDELLKIWTDIYKKHGPVHIVILGGEPFVYPHFDELVKELSQTHTLGITTNLSTDIKNILRETSPSRVSITPTFHPLFAKLEDFLKTAVLLKDSGRGNKVFYLAYPPQIKLIPDYAEKFLKHGMDLKVMTFWGEHDGKKYPQSYTDEEKRCIDPFLGDSCGEKFQLRPRETRGNLCRAGQIYAVIKPNGETYSCGGNNPRYLGNIFKREFKLLNEALPCQSDFCPCNEWASLLVKKDVEAPAPSQDSGTIEVPAPSQSSGAFEAPAFGAPEVRRAVREPEDPEAPYARRAMTKEEEEEIGRNHFIRVDITPKPITRKEITIDRKKIVPNYVFFTWDIHYACNYRCTYCNTPNPDQPLDMWKDRERKKVVYPGLKRWIEVWRDIHERYGSCEIHITGGEPFVYPSFMQLITELSKIHTLEIITNLASDVNEIVRNVTPDRVRIGTTFHPEFADLNEFLEKHKTLRASGFETWGNYVLYPPILEKVPEYKSEFDKLGIPFNMQPYLGFYKEKEYPMAYSDEELTFLKDCYQDDDIVNKKTIEWKTGLPKRNMKGKPCRMGQMYAKVYPTGDAYRCCANNVFKIGNLIENTFELTDEALPCDAEHCYCWRCMLMGGEECWGRHWVIPHKQPVETK